MKVYILASDASLSQEENSHFEMIGAVYKSVTFDVIENRLLNSKDDHELTGY